MSEIDRVSGICLICMLPGDSRSGHHIVSEGAIWGHRGGFFTMHSVNGRKAISGEGLHSRNAGEGRRWVYHGSMGTWWTELLGRGVRLVGLGWGRLCAGGVVGLE